MNKVAKATIGVTAAGAVFVQTVGEFEIHVPPAAIGALASAVAVSSSATTSLSRPITIANTVIDQLYEIIAPEQIKIDWPST